MIDKVVDIHTGQPVKPSGPSSGEQRRTLNHDGKRWQKLQQKMADGEIQISVTAAGQELDMDDMIIPWVDSLIIDDDKASKHREYLKYKSKKQD